MKRLCLVVFVMIACFAWAGELQAKVFSTKEDAKAKVEEFMELIEANEINEAFELLGPYWIFPQEEWTDLQISTSQQMATIESRFGQTVGYDFVRAEVVGDTVLRLTYIQKRERHLIRWIFVFYKPYDRWILNACEWDDKIEALFN